MNTNLISYYKQRASEYENIYLKPERQTALQTASVLLQEVFTGKHIAEIACGTGYWTEKIATTAASVYATDINDTVIEIAKHKHYPRNNVTFNVTDFYDHQPLKKYEGLFGGFIWSHIYLQQLPQFIATTHNYVIPGGTVVFMDNKFVEGSNLPVTATDEQGNTFQTRSLANGSTHVICKNFPSKNFVLEQLKGVADEIRFIDLEYYWIVKYTKQDTRHL
ncbi:MAG: class I SAM-dependent methyltransferase [Bacteroidetes bacterium]|nr:class I SAM-dependent methyltransferase [Bacteroidota bacterium]